MADLETLSVADEALLVEARAGKELCLSLLGEVDFKHSAIVAQIETSQEVCLPGKIRPHVFFPFGAATRDLALKVATAFVSAHGDKGQLILGERSSLVRHNVLDFAKILEQVERVGFCIVDAAHLTV